MADHVLRLTPQTRTVHLAFAAGEDATVRVTVLDRDDQPVPLASAEATIGLRGCPPRHVWRVGEGLELDEQMGVLFLHATSAQTSAWAAWGDSEWQLDVVDLFGREQRPAEGDVRVTGSRRAA